MLEVRIRLYDEADAVPFLKCKFGQQYAVIEDLQRNGGIYIRGNVEPFHSHQYVSDGVSAFFEIVVGKEEE